MLVVAILIFATSIAAFGPPQSKHYAGLYLFNTASFGADYQILLKSKNETMCPKALSESCMPADATSSMPPELRSWYDRAKAELQQAMNFWLIDRGGYVRFKSEHRKTHTRAQLLEIAAQITERQEELAAVEELLELSARRARASQPALFSSRG